MRRQALITICTMTIASCTPSGSPTGSLTEDFTRVASEQSFRSDVVGRELRFEGGSRIVFNSDNSLSGNDAGAALAGDWSWQDGFACWRYTAPNPRDLDCRVVEITASALRYTRDRGNGTDTTVALGPRS